MHLILKSAKTAATATSLMKIEITGAQLELRTTDEFWRGADGVVQPSTKLLF